MSVIVGLNKNVEKSEEQKRQTVYTKPRHNVIIKFLALQGVKLTQLGLEKKVRDDAAIEARHTAEAKKRGLNPKAYREKTDTGCCLIPKGDYKGVYIVGIVDQLKALGLKYVGGHWQEVQGKGPVVFLNFSVEGEEVAMPEQIEELLGYRYNDIVVWANFRYNDPADPSKGQHRLDTINVAYPHVSEGRSWHLTIPEDHPNTYRVV